MKGLFIPNKDTPGTCIDCPCFDGYFNICQVTGEDSLCCDHRPKTCPIIEIEINEKIEKGETK